MQAMTLSSVREVIFKDEAFGGMCGKNFLADNGQEVVICTCSLDY